MSRLDLYVNYELQASIKLQGSDVILGRAPSCAVQIPDTTVSRRHAVIYAEEADHAIENFGANGTKVNGKRISRQILKHGDAISIGGHNFVYDSGQIQDMETTAIFLPDDD